MVNTDVADTLAPCISIASATKLLSMQNKLVLVFHEEWFLLNMPSQCWRIIKNAYIFFMFPTINSS